MARKRIQIEEIIFKLREVGIRQGEGLGLTFDQSGIEDYSKNSNMPHD